MRKSSAYARRQRLAGPTFNGAEWMNTINRVRAYGDAPPPGFHKTQEAASKAEVLVRTALQSLLDCAAPDDTEHAFDLLAHALGVTVIRALQIEPNDNPMLPMLQAGSAAVTRAIERYRLTGAWGLDGAGRVDLMEAVDLYAQVLHMSSPAQMAKATTERMRILRDMARRPA